MATDETTPATRGMVETLAAMAGEVDALAADLAAADPEAFARAVADGEVLAAMNALQTKVMSLCVLAVERARPIATAAGVEA